jgi:hypothetical protein
MSTTAMRAPCGCKAILNKKDPRAAIWKKVFGCLEFPLLSPIPVLGTALGEPTAKFLMGDWEALNFEQKTKMLSEMKKKFGISAQDFVMQNKALGYVPIKDQNVTVVVCQLHTRMMT